MEEIIKEENIENIKPTKKKKGFTILGISIWRILAYFIIYSMAGYIVETIFGIATKGLWESRQSFLYGPFCGVYGIGAVMLILPLQYFTKNHNTLFIGGFLIGSIIEYVFSLIGELVFGVKWWDYSNMPLNIGGRVCVYFSIFWGFLAIYLMTSLHPKIDRLINWVKSKISVKRLKIITFILTIALLINYIATGFAVHFFKVRMIEQHDIQVANKEVVTQQYNDIYGNEGLSNFIYKYWGDKKMIRTFPNLKIKNVNGDIVYFDSFLRDIQPYYYKVFEKKLY